MAYVELAVTAVSAYLTYRADRQARLDENNSKMWKMALTAMGKENTFADDATGRFPSWARVVISFFIIGSVLGGILWVAGQETINISYLKDITQKRFLGLIPYGGTTEVTEVSGLMIDPMMRQIVFAVIGFIFGKTAGMIKR